MTAREQLLSEIEAFLERSGLSPSRFGFEALNDRGFMNRLRAGADVTLGTAERLRAFMSGYEPPKQPPSRGAALSSAA